jgi:uncharacterized protein
MVDEEFEWDDDKAASNLEKHGVSFEQAKGAFDDPFSLEWVDDNSDYGEVRYRLIGMAESRVLFIAYTIREPRIRIISARGALPNEKRRYFEENE